MTSDDPMTDAPSSSVNDLSNAARGKLARDQFSRVLVDIGPLVGWMVVYNVSNRLWPGEAIFIASGFYVVVTLAALVYARVRQKRWPLLLLVTSTLVTVLGMAAIAFHNAVLAYIKPTVINLTFAAATLGSLAFGPKGPRLLLRNTIPVPLPDRVCRALAIRWGLFFVFMAILNEVIWRSYSEAFWANFKAFGALPLMFLFGAMNMPIILKNAQRTSDAETNSKVRPGE